MDLYERAVLVVDELGVPPGHPEVRMRLERIVMDALEDAFAAGEAESEAMLDALREHIATAGGILEDALETEKQPA